MKQVSSSDFNYSLKKRLLVSEEGSLLEKSVEEEKLNPEFSEERRVEEWEDEDYSLLFHGDDWAQKRI